MTDFKTIGKSKQFYDFLKNEISSGEYKPGDKFPSIRNLANKYKISPITVNSVISNLVTGGLLYVEQGRGTFVSERGKSLKKNKKMIGVMLFDFRMESSFEPLVFNSIQENLKDDYFVIPYNSYDDIELFYKGVKGFVELGVDGMILVPPTSEDYNEAFFKSMFTADIPIVLINRRIPSVKADLLTMDFEKGIHNAVVHLIGKNRRNIALIKHSSPSMERQMYNGYVKGYAEAGLSFDTGLIYNWPGNAEDVEPVMKSIVGRADGLIASDYLIYKNRKVIYGSGARIPERLSVIGVNDSVYSRFMNPPLTAVQYPSERIGKEAVRIVMDRIENKSYEGEISKSFIPELIIRSS